ncbi:pentapeptide repeat-containing protein [Nonomuraea sp. NPDC050310]|uniref:pentapeptide repeat-containing protein n=1 Tax=Nonomuraea sp. NPDC050310 TaxID=3154935 RepID=UPI0033F351A3
MLGSDSPAGVHALSALADDWEDERQMCIDVLCAYLRMPPEPNLDEEATAHSLWLSMSEVRATILRLIADHLRDSGPASWCGMDLDLTGIVINHDLDFSGADLSRGRIRFRGAAFSGGLVNFKGAKFSDGTVDFDGAVFSGGRCRGR